MCVLQKFVYPHNVEVHHRKPYLSIDKVNKVPNLVTLCPNCHNQLHCGVQTMDRKIRTTLLKLQEELLKG
ncbi:HNH endonuclease [Paenibacillus sp. sgz302251]|uniref:HNH endonuclease n=1 Tax=Paenibacillus sp. sgz302251 TaxID=3414493 RepID=UPI003C7D0420